MRLQLKKLTGQLDQKDTELDQKVDDIIETDLGELEKTIGGSKDRAEERSRRCTEYYGRRSVKRRSGCSTH